MSSPGDDWSAAQYRLFEDERTRPAIDLLNRVPTPSPRQVIDLGCGPANSTELLVRRWPQATVTGLDSSPDMLRQARERLPTVRFLEGDIARWLPEQAYDVIFANAVLQWLPAHERLLPQLALGLAPGGSLAIQVPDNLDEPSHQLMREVAISGPWRERLQGATAARTVIAAPERLYGMLRAICGRIDIWRTTYHHPLDGPDAIIQWLEATGLRPFLAPLDEAARAAFLDAYRQGLAKAYPPLPDGQVLLRFPRLFLVANRT